MSIGEVIWSPRQSAWVASLAPDGREGIFLALLSLKTLITAIPSTAFNGWMNAAFQPNCGACRDATGHFCAESARLNSTHVACQASRELCVGSDYSPALIAPTADAASLVCPSTCLQCPWAVC